MTEEAQLIIHVPFAVKHERVVARQYAWNNATRGDGEFVIIQRTTSGEGVFQYGDCEHAVPEEMAFIAIVSEASAYRGNPQVESTWEFAWINLYGRLAVDLMRSFRERYGPVVRLDAGTRAGRMFFELVGAAAGRVPSDPYSVSSEAYALIMEWRRELDLQATPTRDPVDEVARACRLRFREPLSVKGLANEVGLTREHLTRIFVREHGLGPAEFLRLVRVAEARSLRRSGRLPLREVALRSGFPSVKAMNRALAKVAD